MRVLKEAMREEESLWAHIHLSKNMPLLLFFGFFENGPLENLDHPFYNAKLHNRNFSPRSPTLYLDIQQSTVRDTKSGVRNKKYLAIDLST